MHNPFRVRGVLALIIVCTLLCASFVHSEPAAQEYPEISTHDLQNLAGSSEQFFLLDARTRLEYEESHIPGAVNIAPPYVEASHCKLPEMKHERIVVYCDDRDCTEDLAVAKNLRTLGFSNVYLYRQGLAAWEAAGLPVHMGQPMEPSVQAEKISLAVLRQIIDGKGKAHIIVDVREPHEYSQKHIPGAINIPLRDFQTRAAFLSPDRAVIVYCNTQKRSYIAYRKLVEMGFQRIFFFSFLEWLEANQLAEKKFLEVGNNE